LAYQAAGTALRRAKRAGVYLLEQKARCKRGGWLPWLEKNCSEISDRSAQEWMQIAKHWDEIVKSAAQRGLDLGGLTQSSALKLLRGTAESSPPSKGENSSTGANTQLPPTDEDIYATFSSRLPAMPPRRVVATIKQVCEAMDASRLAALDSKDLEELIHSSSSLIKQAKAALKR
jgi:hypothetical protein